MGADAAAQADLEGVAYVAAAAAAGCSAADVAPWLDADGKARWETPPEPVVWCEVEPKPLNELYNFNWLGPNAAARAAWLKAHPEALGDAGRRFLQLARRVHAVYSWGDCDVRDEALPPPQPLKLTDQFDPEAHRDPTTRAVEAAMRAAERLGQAVPGEKPARGGWGRRRRV